MAAISLEERVGRVEERLARVEARMDTFATKEDIANLKADLIKWPVIAMAVWGGVLIASMRFVVP